MFSTDNLDHLRNSLPTPDSLQSTDPIESSGGFMDTRYDAAADAYSINSPSPAVPLLVSAEQRNLSNRVESRLTASTPDHFPDSMRQMIKLAHFNTSTTLGIENQCSYEAVAGDASSSDSHAEMRGRYERGLATPEEIIETMIDLGMNSAELLKRTDLTPSMPEDLKSALVPIYDFISQIQENTDELRTLRQSVKVKQLDVPVGGERVNGLILSAKTDFATICSGEYTVTQRTKMVVDVASMPSKWRVKLQTMVSAIKISGETSGESADTKKSESRDPGAQLEHMLSQPNPDDHELVATPEGRCARLEALIAGMNAERGKRTPAKESESAIAGELFERMLDLPNPENPSQTLRTITSESPFVYELVTTIYAYRTIDRS